MSTRRLTLTLIPTSEDFQILDFFIAGDGVIAPEELRSEKRGNFATNLQKWSLHNLDIGGKSSAGYGYFEPP